jgi:hypothetical protein
MSRHTQYSQMSLQQRNMLVDEAKARAHLLREQAIDAAWSALGRHLARAARALHNALWPQSRTQRKEASHDIGIVARRVQNRPRSPLRLMDP